MARYFVAGIILIALAIGVWLLLPNDGSAPGTTVPVADGETTTTSISTTTTDQATSTTTTTPDSHMVTTVEEAEEVLRDLWFGWFEGIYNQDEDRIREVVATEQQVSTARELFGVIEFTQAPTRSGIAFSTIEVLRADLRCTAIWATADASSFRGDGAEGSGVWVLRWVHDSWRLATLWTHKEDQWEADCDAQLS